MAKPDLLTGRVLVAIGDGRATEVATFPIPLRAVLHAADPTSPFPAATIEVDAVSMHEGMRAALHELADAIPEPPVGATFDGGAADVRSSR